MLKLESFVERFNREAMTPSSLAGSAREEVCVRLCGSVANCFFAILYQYVAN